MIGQRKLDEIANILSEFMLVNKLDTMAVLVDRNTQAGSVLGLSPEEATKVRAYHSRYERYEFIYRIKESNYHAMRDICKDAAKQIKKASESDEH